MNSILKLTCLCILIRPAQAAPPQINAILNAASYTLPGLPNSGIAQGSMFVIFGAGLGPSQLVQAGGFPLQPTLAGTSVRVTVGTTALDAYPVYAFENQVAAILPSSTPAGIGLLSVTYNGHTSQAGAFRIQRSAPGILTQNQAGSGAALAQNFNSDADQPRNALTRAAHPGQIITLWATGLGPIAGNDSTVPVSQDLNLNFQMLVGGKAAKVRYKGRSGCCPGIDQVVLEVPAGVEGCYVPVTIRVDDAVSNFATIAVAASGDVCTDVNGLSGADLERWQAGADVSSASISLQAYRDCEDYFPCDAASSAPFIESGSANFYRSGLTLSRAQIGQPPPGSCLVTPVRGGPIAVIGASRFLPLDAGPMLTVSGPNGARQIPLQAPGNYYQQLASATQIQYLTPGKYVVDNGSGGADVGPFQVTLTVPPVFTPTVAGARVTWTGGDPAGYVAIRGSAVSGTTRAASGFVCIERVSAGQFTVPAEVLLSLPADSTGAPIPSISATSAPIVIFRTRGLDFAQFSFAQ